MISERDNSEQISPIIDESWLNLNIIKKPKKNINVAYPIFEQCAELCEDEDWKLVLTKASMNKFPRGFTFSNNTLMFRKKKNVETMDLSNNPEEAMQQSINFFKVFGKIKSVKYKLDANILEKETIKRQRREAIVKWNDNKKKNIKDLLINKFIKQETEKYNLNYKQRKELSCLINVGLNLNYFDSSTIIIENEKITNIIGLNYINDAYFLDIDLIKNTIKNNNKSRTRIKYISNEKLLNTTINNNYNNAKFTNLWKKFIVSYLNSIGQPLIGYKISSISASEYDELESSSNSIMIDDITSPTFNISDS